MRHFGISSRERLGGNDALGSLAAKHYAPLPQGILTPDEPEPSEISNVVWIVGFVGFCCFALPFLYLMFRTEL